MEVVLDVLVIATGIFRGIIPADRELHRSMTLGLWDEGMLSSAVQGSIAAAVVLQLV